MCMCMCNILKFFNLSNQITICNEEKIVFICSKKVLNFITYLCLTFLIEVATLASIILNFISFLIFNFYTQRSRIYSTYIYFSFNTSSRFIFLLFGKKKLPLLFNTRTHTNINEIKREKWKHMVTHYATFLLS